MINVPIKNIQDTEAASKPWFEQFEKMFEEVRQRAFSIFEQRGRVPGAELDDWLQAERELMWSPPMEVVEKDDEFQARIMMPGFEASDIHITGTPGAIVIKAESSNNSEKTEGQVLLTEFGTKKVFRRLDLPSPIDVEKITASLDKGVLNLTAYKADLPKERKVLVKAA